MAFPANYYIFLKDPIDCLGGAVFRKNELLREFLRSDITRLLRQRRCLCALEACSGVIVCCIMIIILLRTLQIIEILEIRIPKIWESKITEHPPGSIPNWIFWNGTPGGRSIILGPSSIRTQKRTQCMIQLRRGTAMNPKKKNDTQNR